MVAEVPVTAKMTTMTMEQEVPVQVKKKWLTDIVVAKFPHPPLYSSIWTPPEARL